MKFFTEYFDNLTIRYIDGGGNLESITLALRYFGTFFKFILICTLLINIIFGLFIGMFCIPIVLFCIFFAICINEMYLRVEEIDTIEKSMEEIIIKDVIAKSIDRKDKE